MRSARWSRPSAHEPALTLVEPLAGVLNRLPTTVVTAMFGSMIKGVGLHDLERARARPCPIYIGGAQVEAMFPFGPLAGAAVNVTLLSNLDEVHVGINSDSAAVPDPDVLRECLQSSRSKRS